MKRAVLAVTLILIISALSLVLYINSPPAAENRTKENISPVTALNISQPDSAGGSFAPKNYPDALNIDEKIRYDDESQGLFGTGDDKNGVSVSVEAARISTNPYIKDLDSGQEHPLQPKQNNSYFLVKLSAAPLGDYLVTHNSPATENFELIYSSETSGPLLVISESDDIEIKNQTSWDAGIYERYVIGSIGRIYVGRTVFSSINNAEGSGPFSGWIIFEVPKSFVLSHDTYLKLSLGGEEVLWKLYDIRAAADVYMSPDSGNIRIVYAGGPDEYLIQGMEAEVEKKDGSKIFRSVEKAEDEESLLRWSEIKITGTGPLTGEDLLTVSLIRTDGEKFIKYRKNV